MSFVETERAAQSAFFARDCGDAAGMGGSPYRLMDEHALLNLAPSIRESAADYFRRHGITWHRHANHGLSSQVCCLNFLMPLVTRPDLLSRLVGNALGIAPPKMLPVEDGAFGEPWLVGFEWIGKDNYLGEWPAAGRPTRGANVTSTDAIVRFRHEGLDETLLIEWKYTEAYGPPVPDKTRDDGKSSGNHTRTARYADKLVDPDGPIRSDLGLSIKDFFWEPFYQLARQQMLAWRMERAAEDGAARVRVLHIAPSANGRLREVTSPAFRVLVGAGEQDAFKAFAAALAPQPDGLARFISKTTEQVFAPLMTEVGDDPWAAYLRDRYHFLGGRSVGVSA
jgi:restriction endonuclease-like protein